MLEASGSIRMENKPTRRVEYIGFNTTEWTPNPELYDVRVRQALNYAIDREAIIQSIMGGYGEILTSIWRKDFPDYDDSIEGYTYDPEKAKELLAEAGYADGFDITLLTTDANHAKAGEVCQAVAAYLGAVGINCTVEIYDDATSRSIVINGQAQQLCPGMFDWNWASKPGLSDSTLTGVIRSDGMTSYNCLEGYDELIDRDPRLHDNGGKGAAASGIAADAYRQSSVPVSFPAWLHLRDQQSRGLVCIWNAVHSGEGNESQRLIHSQIAEGQSRPARGGRWPCGGIWQAQRGWHDG